MKKAVENWQSCPLLFSTWGKGPSPFGQSSSPVSHQYLIVSCSSCKQLFWIDLFHLKQKGILPLQFVLPGKRAHKSEELSAVLFYVVHWTEISLDNPPVISWEPATEKRELQVSNDPLNASLIVQQLSIETVS